MSYDEESVSDSQVLQRHLHVPVQNSPMSARTANRKKIYSFSNIDIVVRCYLDTSTKCHNGRGLFWIRRSSSTGHCLGQAPPLCPLDCIRGEVIPILRTLWYAYSRMDCTTFLLLRMVHGWITSVSIYCLHMAIPFCHIGCTFLRNSLNAQSRQPELHCMRNIEHIESRN